MTKARTLANFISDGSTLADGAISVSEVSGAAPLASPSFTGNLTVDTDTLFVDAGADHVNINTSSDLGGTLNVNGNVVVSYSDPSIASITIEDSGTSQAGLNIKAGSGTTNRATRVNFYNNVTSSSVPRWSILNDYYQNGDNGFWVADSVGNKFLHLNSNQLAVGSGNFIINEDSDDIDFRVESDSNTHMLFVDAGNNRVGINESSPVSALSVNGDILSNWGNSGEQKIGIAGRGSNIFSSTEKTLIITGADALAGSQAMQGGDVIVRGGVGAGNEGLSIYAGHLYLEGGLHTGGVGAEGGAGKIYMKTAGYERLNINQYGQVTINEVGDDADFRVESSSNSHMLFVDASTNRITMGSTQSNDSEILTLGSAGQATYSSSAAEGMLGLVRYNNTGNPNQHSGLFFRVSTNNGSNNSNASIGLKQPSSSSHNSQFYFNLRSQSQNAFRQYALIDSENGFIMNDGGESYMDFRVESDTNSQALWVDAGNDVVKIGGSGELNPSMVLQLLGAMGLMKIFNVSSTESRIAEGTGGLFLCRDDTYGGVALVLYEFSAVPTIIAQTGSNFTTSTPTGTQVQFKAGSTPAPFGMKAVMASGQTTQLRGGAIICDPT